MNGEVDLGTRLREARQDLGLSQEFVAERIAIPRSALSDIERGRRSVSAAELQRFATLFGRSANELLSGSRDDDHDESLRALARAARDLSEDNRTEVLHFAQFLRNRARSTRADSPT